ncbi:hypothetical protein LZK98_11625 [Sphingomonas cannabina]|uniref:hypothetical protein n=1 Tax=Sphingomonas cannabina TaxID=2899123 RepID=UPI001F1DA52E|nr:hypothetical protein [Sphingomonas cannabina]UIJ43740.1 hypothetical protein LZK98_11625 [Sphingomonas cannabina]
MRTIVLAALLLASCKTPPAPGIEVRTVTKTVEVQRPCAATKPKRPAPIPLPMPTDALQLAAVLGAKLAEYAGPGAYADRAEAVIDECTRAK